MMIRIIAKCMTLVLLVGLLLLGSTIAYAADPPKQEFVPGEIIVKFEAGVRPQSLGTDDQGRLVTDLSFLNVLSARHGVTDMDLMAKALPAEPKARAALSREGLDRIYKLKVDEKADLAQVIRAFKSSPYVEYAEPNYIAYISGTPNDPGWSSQWGMAKIEAPAAWDITTGSDSVTIAILDTGVDLLHPDLSGKLASGWDFVNNDNTPQDDHGHGTHVAGIAAAKTDNGVGVAGVSWGAEIMPVKVMDDSGRGTNENIYNGIIYAADKVNIINLSIGGPQFSALVKDGVEYAHNLGCVVVAAAGNDDSSVNYPARYPEVIAVAATDSNDQRASFSNYGSEVDVAAPGVDIYSTYWWGGSTYGVQEGTSQASPHVAGLAALIWSVNPNLNNTQVESIIKQTADDLGTAGRDNYYGFGRINARRALEATAPSLDTLASMSFLADPSTNPSPQTLRIGNGAMYGTLQWSAVENPDVPWLSIGPPTSGNASPPLPGELTVGVDKDVAGQGTHSGAIRVTSSNPYIQNSPWDVNVTLIYPSSLEKIYFPLLLLNYGNWIDITADGTVLSLGDDDVQKITLPFDFRFYGTTYNELWVSSNGFVSFANGDPGSTNACLPNTNVPNNAIYAFWDDLQPADGGGDGTIYAKQVDSGMFVLEWHEVSHFGSSNHETFEIVLKEDNTILLQYHSLSSTSSATVGVENADGTVAQQYWCNGSGSPLYNGLAIEFTTP